MSIYHWDSGSGLGGLEDFLLGKEKKRLHAILQKRRREIVVHEARLDCANAVLAGG